MDPIGVAGLVVGIVALYSACRDCYIFFTTVKSAEKESLIYLRELDIQQNILKSWGFYWEIQRHGVAVGGTPAAVVKDNGRLNRYLEGNIYKAHGVISALYSISDTLSNGGKLMKRYGLNLKSSNEHEHEIKEPADDIAELVVDHSITSSSIQTTVNKIRQRLSALNRCRWAIKDKEQFKKLTADLRSHNDTLYRFCPEGAFEAMNTHFILECLWPQKSFIGLRRTSKLAGQLLENNEMSPSHGSLQMLASVAGFKAEVVKLCRARALPEETIVDNMFDPSQLKDLGGKLALLEGKVVYLERKSYRETFTQQLRRSPRELLRRTSSPQIRSSASNHNKSENLDYESGDASEYESGGATPDREMRADILKLWYTLRNIAGSKVFLSLKPIGLTDYLRGRHKYHIGLIYELPGSLGTTSLSAPAEDVKLRAPRRLTELQLHDKILTPLGTRFELARKVFNAVVFLHASGWLHKNIRTGSIILFLKLGEDGCDIELDNPYLAGYDFSRPDDVPLHDFDTTNFPQHLYSADQLRRRPTTTRRAGEIKLDYYHHPDKRASPNRAYRHAYDVYSLGIVLLEIGLWYPIEMDYKPEYEHDEKYDPTPRRFGSKRFPEDPYEFRRYVIAEYLDKLRFMCGDIYAEVVHKCLMVNANDSEVDEASQRALCARVAADLSECRA